MKKHLFFILTCLLLFCSKSEAQTYGNEWINSVQKYLKIRVSEEGIYKITPNDITAGSFQTGMLNPSKFQIFNKGVEIPLYITGAADGSFDSGDLIYFYGNKNNASLDKVLYKNATDLPNSEVSLFENDNYYFLTYSTANDGARYSINTQINNTLTPEPFIICKERVNQANSYYPGEYILEAMSLSEYTEGEGYLGVTFGKGESQTYQLNTTGFLNSTLFQPTVSFYVAGRSNASSTNTQGKNHHLRLSSNGTTAFDSLYKSYSTIRKTVALTIGSSNTPIVVSSVDDLGALTDFQALGFIELNYSRNLDLSNLKTLTFNVSSTKEVNLLNFTNSSLTTAFILEKNGTNIYFTNSTTASQQFSLKNTNTTTNYYLADLALSKPVTSSSVSFKNISPASSKNYLMISHNSLSEGALAYKQYNESIGMPTALVYTEDLYDEFYYGFHHPMALRNYCNYMIEKGSVKPEYLLLLGKGLAFSKQSLANDLVPTFGFPPSDNMLTSGLNNSNLEPGLATGRVPAVDNKDVLNYLNKLKTYNNLPDSIWRKKMLFISGGKTLSENLSFQSYQNSLSQVAKKDFFGAQAIYVKKNITTPVTESFTDIIVKETQSGIGLISFLGHGSTVTTEVLMGEPSTLGNKDKPTVYLVNGCSTADAFTEIKSLGEQFLLQKDFGAIGWIGTTSEGVASYLNNASLKLYENWFSSNYGSSIASGIKKGLKANQNANDKLNLAHLRQYLLLGDPYITFYSSEKPDYSINSNDIFPTISNQNANSAKLQIGISVKNLGKALNDSLEVEVLRTLPDNAVIRYPIYKMKPVFNSDTLKIELDNQLEGIAGKNQITVKLNSGNKIQEKSTINNSATTEIFLAGNGLNLIYPLKNAIEGSNQVTLKAQPDDLFTKKASYIFEIDTVPTFTSSFKKTSPLVEADLLPTWTPAISYENVKLYYWRARLNLPIDQGGQWSISSFTYIKNESEGYSVSAYAQLKEFDLKGIKTGDKYLEFLPDFFPTTIQTRGDNASKLDERRFRYGGLALGYCDQEFAGISIITYDPVISGKRFNYPSPFNCTNIEGPNIGYTGQYRWDTNNPVEQDSLLSYLRQIPIGSNVIGFNGNNAAFNELPQTIKNELRNLGLIEFENVKRGEPYMFWGKKGELPGTAIEKTADYSSNLDPKQQLIKNAVDLTYRSFKGSITSGKVGPAYKWNDLNSNFSEKPADKITYTIIGVATDNSEKILIENYKIEEHKLATIDAEKYPFIRYRIDLENEQVRVVPDLKQLKILFQPVPEISFNPQYSNKFYSNELAAGDSIKVTLGLSNLSKYKTDSISLYYQIVNNNKVLPIRLIARLSGLAPFENTLFSISDETKSIPGENLIKFSVSYKNFEDAFQFNNYIVKPFKVNKDDKEPLVSVLFDGRNIVNGEIVSATPSISISVVDENKFLLMNDTTNIKIYLKGSKESDFRAINYASGELTFTPSATKELNQSVINFRPPLLSDDTYTLKISSKDNTGNGSNSADFVTEFLVINESSISNFYPYPNPVIDAMKFVFTLTGAKIPDKIKIQILTATGKIVREIDKSELGNLRIGNNISDFTWNGTDQHGDRLANGVYFYKVTVEEGDNGSFKKRKTTSKEFFKNNIGKIYLLK